MTIDTPLFIDGSSGSAEWAMHSEFRKRFPTDSCRSSVGCVSCSARIATLCFLIKLFRDPHLSCRWPPRPFMLSEASASCFRCLRGWCSPSAGTLRDRGVASGGSGVRRPVSWLFNVVALFGVDSTPWLRRVCLLPPSRRFPAGSRLPWTFRPSTPVGGFILFLFADTVLGVVSPGGGFDRCGSAKPPS